MHSIEWAIGLAPFEEDLLPKVRVDDDTSLRKFTDVTGTLKPDMEWYEEPIKIATSKSLSEMLWPFLLVLLTPLLLGVFFGKFSLAGLIVGGVASGVQMALAGANSGG